MPSSLDLSVDDDFLICKACGTQFSVHASSGKKDCRICDDTRQFVPPTGQAFTTLKELKANGYRNVWKPDDVEKGVTSIFTEPKLGIGQRCILLETEHGNILWDMIAFLDAETVEKINALGGLKAIVISHPHYYTTHTLWSRAFNCPIYVSADDEFWLDRTDLGPAQGVNRQLVEARIREIVPGVTMVKCGGHFPGSVCLHWRNLLFIADTILSVPSGFNPTPRPTEVASYSFMWSIPNFIPMNPDMIHGIWRALQPFAFHTTFGAFDGITIRGGEQLKLRLLESMKIAVRNMGYGKHALLEEQVGPGGGGDRGGKWDLKGGLEMDKKKAGLA